jgi:hypothetical protein
MNPAAISALAVLGGSSVGALAPVLSNYVLQRSVTRRDLINHEIAERQQLFSDFITQAARLHAESMTQNVFQLEELTGLYALVSRIRLISSEAVVQAAEDMMKVIIKRYGEENVTLEDLRTAALSSKADPLNRFSTACRRDLRNLSRSG